MAIDPFSVEGAKRISEIAGQPLATSATVLSTTYPTLHFPSPAVEPPPALPSIESILKYEPSEAVHRQDTILDDITDKTKELAGEDAYRAAQEQEFGLQEKRATVRDLTSQFNSLHAEAEAIPLEIQQEFSGRGATRGGVEPIEMSRKRDIAIRQLGVSAALNAANGNLATAQDQVETAVRAKFAPLRAEFDAKKTQLAALEPRLEREDKALAEKKRAELADRDRLLDQQQEEQQSIYNLMVEAAKNGASATILRNIQNAKTVTEAITAGGSSFASPDTQLVQLDDGRDVLVDMRTGRVIASFGGIPSSDRSRVVGSILNVGPGKSGASRFTKSQLNKGANNASVSYEQFSAWPYELQNYYVNSSASQLKAISDQFSAVRSGQITAAKVTDLINSSNAPDVVKNHLKTQVGLIQPTTSAKQGFFKQSWDSVKHFLGI